MSDPGVEVRLPASAPEAENWFSPSVRGIGAASLLSDLGHEVPTALLPSFLTSTLGAPAAALGVIEGVADGLAGAARLGGGALADDPGRRRATAVGGYTATAVLSGLIGVATSAWQVGVLRAGAWTARGLRVPSRNALLADAVPRSTYGRAYGFERAMDNLGAIGGPLLAIALVAAFSTRAAILVSIVPGLLAALAIIYAIRRLPRLEAHERQPIRLRVRPVLHGRLGALILGVGAFEFGNIAATLLILRATELLEPERGLDSATTAALLLYAGYNLAATLASIPAGHLGDRRGMVRVLLGGVLLFGAAYVVLAATGASIVLLLVGFVLAGVGIGCVETAEHAASRTACTREPAGLGLWAAGSRAELRQPGGERSLDCFGRSCRPRLPSSTPRAGCRWRWCSSWRCERFAECWTLGRSGPVRPVVAKGLCIPCEEGVEGRHGAVSGDARRWVASAGRLPRFDGDAAVGLDARLGLELPATGHAALYVRRGDRTREAISSSPTQRLGRSISSRRDDRRAFDAPGIDQPAPLRVLAHRARNPSGPSDPSRRLRG